MTKAIQAGTIAGLWRYPVSSMAGEALAELAIGEDGVVGDRIFGVRDAHTGTIASPGRNHRFVTVPNGFARYVEPDGIELSADGLHWAGPNDVEERERLEIIFGFTPHFEPFVARNSTGFRPRYEHAPIHLLTTAAMRNLRKLLPGAVIEPQRFRPNILLDLAEGDETAPEHHWVGRQLSIGDAVLSVTEPCVRCPFVTIAQDGVPKDAEVLRQIVQHHDSHFGIYCDVVTPGRVRFGDHTTLL